MSLSTHCISQFRPQQSYTFQTESQLTFNVNKPLFFSFYRDSIRDLLYYDEKASELMVARNTGNGGFSDTKKIAALPLPTSFSAGNLNNDGIDDIVSVFRELNKVIVLLSDRRDSSYSQTVFIVNFYPEHAVIGDMTGDNVPDVIVLGKLSSGVTVIRGKGRDAFYEPKTLFPSVAVSSLSIINLNNDAMPDIVVRNWLNNEDIFYFGLGNLQFSEQTVLSYGNDSTMAMFIDLNGDNISDAIVSSTQLTALLIYNGDGLGNYFRTQNISVQHGTSHLMIGNVRSSSFADIILQGSASNRLLLLLNKKNGEFFDGIEFGLPFEQNIVLSEDINGDGLFDIMCFDDRSDRYAVIWNSGTIFDTPIEHNIVVGKNPSNISVNDINNDGCDDILVSNLVSNTVSILLGDSEQIQSQVSIEAADQPTSVSVYSKNDTSITLFTVHANTSKIGLITLSATADTNTSLFGDIEFYTISLAGKPSYVLPDISLKTKLVSMYMFSRSQPSAITFYQQIEGTKFIAKSLTPLVPSSIVFSTIEDLDNDGMSDLIYIYNDNRLRKNVLGVTLNDMNAEFSGNSFSFILPDTNMKRAFIFVEDINSDQLKDYLIYNQSAKTLSVVFGGPAGGFNGMKILADSVIVTSIHQIQFFDFDADGINDMLYSDQANNVLYLLKGRGNGLFEKKKKLKDLPGESIFRCGDFNGDGKVDIVFSYPDKNTIQVHYGL